MLGKCEDLIIISRCCYGGYSPFVKTVLDRAISYIHPDFVFRKREMHHKRRYRNVITFTVYLYGENITDAEKNTAIGLVQANADNYDGKVKNVSFHSSASEMEGIVL